LIIIIIICDGPVAPIIIIVVYYLGNISPFTPGCCVWLIFSKSMLGIQYVWGQYAMRNLRANSARPTVDKFTNFMVGRNPLVIKRLLPHSKSDAASSQGASFFSLKILLN
jgi:hypothetical protein